LLLIGNADYADMPSEWTDPEVGEPFVVESLAIVKGTDKYDPCVELCNWLGGCREGL